MLGMNRNKQNYSVLRIFKGSFELISIQKFFSAKNVSVLCVKRPYNRFHFSCIFPYFIGSLASMGMNKNAKELSVQIKWGKFFPKQAAPMQKFERI